jgi:hypothetical protein
MNRISVFACGFSIVLAASFWQYWSAEAAEKKKDIPSANSTDAVVADPHTRKLMQMIRTGKGVPTPSPGNMRKAEVVGEVIDLWCYTSETMGPGRGKDHLSCASLCAAGGVPLAILDDKGDIYIAAKSKEPYKGCLETLGPYIGKRVKVTGFVAEKRACKAMKIISVDLSK